MENDEVMANPQGPPKTEPFEDESKRRSFWGWVCLCFRTLCSWIFGFWFLFTLLFCAEIAVLWQPRTKKDPNVKLTKAQRKLTRSLQYYIELAGYRLESHEIFSPDGWSLDLTRIRASKAQEINEKGPEIKRRYPVLLLPGLMQHVGAYCSAGPDAMALLLYRAGFDVWLGNTRSSLRVNNRKHSEMSPKTWDWSIEDMALTDVPSLIAHVQKKTGAKKVAVVGHSQGTTQLFMCLSKNGRPEVGNSISTFCALAPAVFAGPAIDRWFLKMLRRKKWAFRLMIGDRAFLGIMTSLRSGCPMKIYTHSAYDMFFYMLNWSDKLWDRHYRNRSFIFTPSMVSSNLMFWWLGKGGFGDTRCIFKSPETNEPWFGEQFPKAGLFTCGQDNLCDPVPLKARMETVENHVPYTIFDYPDYAHLDVMWAKDAPERVTIPMGKFIWDNLEDKDSWREPVWPAAGDQPSETVIDPATHDVDLEALP